MMADAAGRCFEQVIRWMKVAAIPPGVRLQLAYHLDHFGVGDWKDLADQIGLQYLPIKSIENRVRFTTHLSCTLFLFERHLDSMDLTVADLVNSFSAIGNKACIAALQKAFEDGSLFSLTKGESNVRETNRDAVAIVRDKRCHGSNSCAERLASPRSCPPISVGVADGKAKNSSKKIFITHSEDANEVARLVTRWLAKYKCVVHSEDYADQLLYENKLEWYDTRYSEADHILILVSPQYARDIGRRESGGEMSRFTCYINARMQAEYVRNLCRNKRFLLVMLPGASHEHVPIWLRHSTTVYHWPQHCEHIVRRIENRMKPTAMSIQRTPIVVTTRN